LTPQTEINARPLDSVLLPAPWHRGRVILIGDAAHATTPHLASGAGAAVEDGIVLAEALRDHSNPHAAFAAFMERRFERCRLVVDSSVRIGAMQQAHASPHAIAGLIDEAQTALRAEI
jgi:2-polyprenyl-6-methoxyphenol hydroxylase-like FAD-dependent oxidoreductase